MTFTNIKYNKMSRSSFFKDVKTDDLPTLDDMQIDDKACCQSKKLAYDLVELVFQNKGFPFNDPELLRRSQNGNLNVHQMRPFNEFAIKIMRKFNQKEEEESTTTT